ncbi:Tfp pilus assembly protein FimT/FimU [Planctomycetota bacterium]
MISQRKIRSTARAYTLIELMIVIGLLGLLVAIPQLNFLGIFERSRFEASLQDFVSTLQMAGRAAAESDRRYQVIIDQAEGTYTLRQITTTDLSDVLDEEIIDEAVFGSECEIVLIQFDDGEYVAADDRIMFTAGHAGWYYGGRIVFEDRGRRRVTVLVNRLNRIVKVERGEVELNTPRDEESMFF